jgi:hypothetical protein
LQSKIFPFCSTVFSPQGLFVLALKPGWLVLSCPELVEGELQLYQLGGVVELAHHLVLVFPMTEVQWKLRGWDVVPATLLEVKP